MTRLLAALTLTLLAWFAAPAGGAAAADQPARDATRPFSHVIADWTRLLDRAEQQLTSWQVTLAQLEELRVRMAGVKADAEALRQQALADAAANKKLIDALGPLPEPGQPLEPEAIAAQRRQLSEESALFAARAQQAEFAAARAERLVELAGRAARETVARAVLERGASPLGAPLWRGAASGLAPAAAAVPRMAADWWRNQAGRGDLPWTTLLIFTVVVIGAGVPAGSWLRRRHGRAPERTPPTPRQLLAATLAASFLPAVLPTLLIGGWFAALDLAGLNTGAFGNIISGLASVAAAYLMFAGLAQAALAPREPAWRLIPIADASALALSRILKRMALFLALGALAGVAGRATSAVAAELGAAFSLLFHGGIGVYLLALTRHALWRGKAAADGGADTPQARGAPGGWFIVRLAVRFLAMAALAALLGAFYNLGEYLTESLLLSGVILAGYALLRIMLREGVAAFAASQRELAVALRRVLSGTDDGPRFAMWIGLALQAVLVTGAMILLLLAWRIPWRAVADLGETLAQGITVGGVTISLAGLAAAVTVFALALVGTRLIQRGVRHRILPRTNLDEGVRHSIVAGIGYVGVVIALVAGVATLGLNLTNFALIAGALSVGVGFGLQNVVSNFVSGVILLIERPIKVGDRIVVGGKEGHVRRINVRATEIETSERAAVIIPNSEFISTAVTNWTHRDRRGRVEVKVGVAYGTDPEKVRDVLLACAKAHRTITRWPEPGVSFQDFGPSELVFRLLGFVDDVETKGEVESDLRYAIIRAFAENGIVIPFPQREISIKDLDRLLGAARGGGA
jgi:potassium-dependent mechanosensitive channel